MADLPTDMVEAAARALAQHLAVTTLPHWVKVADAWNDPPVPSTAVEQWQDDFRQQARVVLAAALATGEVREERGQLAPPGTRDVVRLVRRTVHSLPSGHVLTSPWEEVSD